MIEKYTSIVEHQMYAFYCNLKEREPRHYAAIEALKMGHGERSTSKDCLIFIKRRLKELLMN